MHKRIASSKRTGHLSLGGPATRPVLTQKGKQMRSIINELHTKQSKQFNRQERQEKWYFLTLMLELVAIYIIW